LSLQGFAQFATHLQFAATPYNLTTAENIEELTFTFSQKTGRKTTKASPPQFKILATKPQKSDSIKTHQSKITQITNTNQPLLKACLCVIISF
jgi:hypothetical protein